MMNWMRYAPLLLVGFGALMLVTPLPLSVSANIGNVKVSVQPVLIFHYKDGSTEAVAEGLQLGVAKDFKPFWKVECHLKAVFDGNWTGDLCGRAPNHVKELGIRRFTINRRDETGHVVFAHKFFEEEIDPDYGGSLPGEIYSGWEGYVISKTVEEAHMIDVLESNDQPYGEYNLIVTAELKWYDSSDSFHTEDESLQVLIEYSEDGMDGDGIIPEPIGDWLTPTNMLGVGMMATGGILFVRQKKKWRRMR